MLHELAAALLALALFALAAWGWGGLALRNSSQHEGGEAPYRVALGIAAFAAIGGWLNLLGMAYPPSLWALLAAGWLIAARDARHFPWKKIKLENPLAWLLVALVGVFLAATLMPSELFNWDDDFYMYFPRPVRMLQTGTLAGDPFETLGLDSLGAHAFLQGFTLLVFRVDYLNAFDAVACVLLVLALIVMLARRLSSHWMVLFAALAAALLVHPQQVNIAPVYSRAALCLALVPAAVLLAQGAGAAWRCAIPAGLILAALISLKTTSLSLVAPGLFVFAATLAAQQGGLRRALRKGAALAACTALFLLPWLLLNAPRYGRLFAGPPGESPVSEFTSPLYLLRPYELRFGADLLAFNFAACIVLGATLFGLFRLLSSREARPAYELHALLALCAGAIAAYVLNTIPFGLEHGLRQSTYALIAGLPAALIVLGHLAARASRYLGAAIPLGLALLFGPSFGQRVFYAAHLRTISPLTVEHFIWTGDVMKGMLGPAGAAWMRRAQARIPPGERFMAFVSHPHHLYFARNPVYVAMKLGIAAFGPELGSGSGPAHTGDVLSKYGVRYVLWQSRGMLWDDFVDYHKESAIPGDQRIALSMQAFMQSVESLAQAHPILHNEHGLVVIDLHKLRPAPP